MVEKKEEEQMVVVVVCLSIWHWRTGIKDVACRS